jgi:hypothetical protein
LQSPVKLAVPACVFTLNVAWDTPPITGSFTSCQLQAVGPLLEANVASLVLQQGKGREGGREGGESPHIRDRMVDEMGDGGEGEGVPPQASPRLTLHMRMPGVEGGGEGRKPKRSGEGISPSVFVKGSRGLGGDTSSTEGRALQGERGVRTYMPAELTAVETARRGASIVRCLQIQSG